MQLLKRLKNSTESFKAQDFFSIPEIESLELIAILQTPNWSLITDLSFFLAAYIEKDTQLLNLVEKLLPENPQLRDEILSLLEIEDTIKMNYHTRTQEFTPHQGKSLAPAVFNLSSEYETKLQSLPVEEWLLTLKLLPNSIIHYTEFIPPVVAKSNFLTPALELVMVGVISSLLLSHNPTQVSFSSKLPDSQIHQTISETPLTWKINSAHPQTHQLTNLLEETYADLANHHLFKNSSAQQAFQELSANDFKQVLDYSYASQHQKHHQKVAFNGVQTKTPDDAFHQEKVTAVINSFYNHPKRNAPEIAQLVLVSANKHQVDYHLLLSIIKVESDFRQIDNSTGDISLAQINYDIWAEELHLDKNRLHSDIAYGIDKMAEILEIVHKRHHKDPYWYARYHSSTPSKKIEYAKKVSEQLQVINSREIEINLAKIQSLVAALQELQSKSDIFSLVEKEINKDQVLNLVMQLQLLSEQAQDAQNVEPNPFLVASN